MNEELRIGKREKGRKQMSNPSSLDTHNSSLTGQRPAEILLIEDCPGNVLLTTVTRLAEAQR